MINCEAGQTFASLNEWEAVKLIYSHKGRYSQGWCFKESCCHMLYKYPGLSSNAGEEKYPQ